MLTGLNVFFWGGDARQLEMIRKFCELDANVTLIGFDNLRQPFPGVTMAEPHPPLFAHADALILPTVVTDETGKIESLFSSREMVLTDEILSNLPEHAVVYTGLAKPFLKQWCQKHHVKLVELFERDDVAIYNSIPTAEGAIMMAIENTDITIHSSRAIVLGLGRTGMTLARTLKGMGAFVKVGVRRSEHFARAEEMGLGPFYMKDLAEDVSDCDLLFNTVPAPVVTARVIANMPHHAVIIDLASSPGGTDFRFAEKRGIKALLAPGLPGIVAPKTAGQILAKCLAQLLSETAKKRRDQE